MSDPSPDRLTVSTPHVPSGGTPEPEGRTTAQFPSGTAPADPLSATSRYVLGEELARGGMGVVFRAVDTVLEREVAVKVLRTGSPTSPARSAGSWSRRASPAGWNNPSVPAVHDLGTLPDGRPFLAMKLIAGRTLSDLIAARPDPADRRRLVVEFEQICQASCWTRRISATVRSRRIARR